VIAVSPPVKPKLPAPIIVKQVIMEEAVLPEAIIPELRDPFLSSKNPQELIVSAVKKPAVELKLSGILWDDNVPSAIINSSIVKIGDLIEEKTVVDIEKNRVIMMENGKILVIELRKQ
jgi:type II secretory pathway component PulC